MAEELFKNVSEETFKDELTNLLHIDKWEKIDNGDKK